MGLELLMILPISIYALSQAMCNKFHDYERDSKNEEERYHFSKKWHFWQGLEHISVFSTILLSVFIGSWEIMIILPFIYWFLFDGIRALTLKKKWFYLGANSKLDSFGKTTNVIKTLLLVTSIILYVVLKLIK